jgi:hypothetical protein
LSGPVRGDLGSQIVVRLHETQVPAVAVDDRSEAEEQVEHRDGSGAEYGDYREALQDPDQGSHAGYQILTRTAGSR